MWKSTSSVQKASSFSDFVWKWHETRRNWPNLKKHILFGINNCLLAVFPIYFEFQAFLIPITFVHFHSFLLLLIGVFVYAQAWNEHTDTADFSPFSGFTRQNLVQRLKISSWCLEFRGDFLPTSTLYLKLDFRLQIWTRVCILSLTLSHQQL